MKNSIRKSIFRRSRAACLAACMAGTVLFSPFGVMSVKAASMPADGKLWIGNTQVTDANCADIFGDGTASYDPDTLTLTLNGVHIGPDDCHIEDDEGNTQTAMSQKDRDWGIYSLYAKNTVAHLVINGNNTFETPVVERVKNEVTYAGRDVISEQLEIQDGIIIDSSGIAADSMSITGSGTLKSFVPAIVVEEERDKADKNGGLPTDFGQGGIALYWIGAGKTLTIGTSGGEGPALDLRGGIAGLAVDMETEVYNADLTLQALKGNDYGCYYSPHAYPLYNNGDSFTLCENTKMKANIVGRINGSDDTEIYNLYNFTNDVTLRDEEDYQTFWYSDAGSDDSWVIWGTARQEEEAKAAAERSRLGLDPTAEDYVDPAIDVQGFTEDAIVYSVDVEWGAMTFQYENTTWDVTEHKTVGGAGWKVYDSAANEALDSTTELINQIEVTNHSNADVWVTLVYKGAPDYEDTSGSFETKADDAVTVYDATGEYLTLASADNNEGEAEGQGKETVGTVYFMPSGIKEDYKKADGIAKWSQLGTITVGLLTEQP